MECEARRVRACRVDDCRECDTESGRDDHKRVAQVLRCLCALCGSLGLCAKQPLQETVSRKVAKNRKAAGPGGRVSNMDLDRELERILTRRQLFGLASSGIGVAALASLLKPTVFADTQSGRDPKTGGLSGLPHFAPK